MARGDRDVASRAKSGGFGAVPLGFATNAPRGSAGSSTENEWFAFLSRQPEIDEVNFRYGRRDAL
jgi:hypothetical protein